jgi:(1->4)-alpha-D-glucan 1-alpha-D-glucosylmutase
MQKTSNVLNHPSSQLCDCFDRLFEEKRQTLPSSTYRVQLNGRFHFRDACQLIPYLSLLGIGHLYSSPILKAQEGSQHGYDIIDHNQINPEIGTEVEFRGLAHQLKQRGMGLLLDTVPNHMGVGNGNNPWWQNVLQNGRSSIYADFFDIDWEPLKPELWNKVLIPILGKPYGEELESGNITVVFHEGQFAVRYFDRVLPVDPQTIPLIFAPVADILRTAESSGRSDFMELGSLLTVLSRLPLNCSTESGEVRRRLDEAPHLLEQFRQLASRSPEITAHIHTALQLLNGNPDDGHSFDALHELLERQAYRLAFWRVSGEEINYRRFFDINDLVGLRMENSRVFAETHRLIRRFLAEGLISGLRLDHPDGLLNPSQYIMRLQRLFVASRCIGPEPAPPLAADGIELEVHGMFGQELPKREHAPLYLLVEKILEPGEHLPDFWPVDGSVGYDFANLVNGIFIERRNERTFTRLYERIIGDNVRPQHLIYRSKKLVMRRALASEVNVLAHMLNEISNRDRRARDFTLGVLREAIRETIACFPVYRTYIDERAHVSDSDRDYIRQAIACAKQKNESLAPAVFDFLQTILLLESSDNEATIYGYRRKLYFTLKFQQLTGPVMAKGLEDTTCYVYARFISVNEVGGSPDEFGTSVPEFHRSNTTRVEKWPHSMLSSSTHDTKRSEDVRARLNVLSEMPAVWTTQVMKWRRINHNLRSELSDGRVAPDNNEEYFLYQTLVGAWPLAMNTEGEKADFLQRMQQYMEKAVHEAKVNLSWLNPNAEYAEAVRSFVQRILAPTRGGKSNLFQESFRKFVQPVMYFGLINSLAQTVLKLTAPGVPDIYQGQEMWDFSLVDPDNRRPVDFALREQMLKDLLEASSSMKEIALCEEMLSSLDDGRTKLWVTAKTLNFRRAETELFQWGDYLPLQVSRGREEHAVAFARTHAHRAVIVAVPRLSYTLMKGKEEPPIGAAWGESELSLPNDAIGKTLCNIFTGERHVAGTSILCRELFASLPVAVLGVE